VALAVVFGTAAPSLASHLVSSLSEHAEHTTLEKIVVGDRAGSNSPYSNLRTEDVSRDYVVRDPAGVADEERDQRRRSLAYFGQLTDFQLADEESPARVEFLDPGASSAWRPQEAFHPFVIDYSIRQMNLFADASPILQGNDVRAPMDFSLMTGDQADNAQRNEMIWVRELLEGGDALNFNSGIKHDTAYSLEHESCAAYPPNAAEAKAYTGVQDYDDYDESQTPLYYDPDQPRGQFATWPTWTGLMDRAQQLVTTPEGTAVPSYVTSGNHDPLAQGNEDPIEEFEDIATGCFKMLASSAQPGPGVLDPNVLTGPASASTLIPPDPLRRYVSKPQLRAIYGGEDDSHGYDFVDIEELKASCPAQLQPCDDATARREGSASYYAWDPPETPGFRFISIDTVAEGGQTAEGVGCGSANGNIDDPQFQWLDGELQAASAQDKLIVIFGHHPVRSMCTEIADEQAAPCTVGHVPPRSEESGDVPQHDRNPGCDIDPRFSEPIHLGSDPQPGDPRESFVELLAQYPHVIAYVAGHTHDNKVLACGLASGCTGQGNWWEINTAATADWPVQHRLVEVMDNRDGSLSLFGTILDHAAAAAAPGSGSAAAFDKAQLASIGRVLAYNDPQAGVGTGQGTAADQNVELLVKDPREADLSITKADSPDPVLSGQELTYTINVSNAGPSATGATLRDTLPAGVTYVSATASQGVCSQSGGIVTCGLGEVASDELVTVTIKVKPQGDSRTITNTATVDSTVPDSNVANNTATETTDVQSAADIAVTKTDSPDPVHVGQQLTYTITVKNNGGSNATGVILNDLLPKTAGFGSVSTSQGSCTRTKTSVRCNLGSLASGASATVTIIVKPTQRGTITNTASATATRPTDPLSTNNSSTATTTVRP
jgi:uncharacterized repeat protein (TIGR01451 family)